MTDEKHWIDDDKTRKAFWAHCKNTLGLDESEVYAALSVDSIHDFDGNKDMARALLASFDVDSHRVITSLTPQETVPGAREHTTAFCDMFAPDGTRIAVTAREGATADTVALTALALWDGAQILTRLGWTLAAENGKQVAEQLLAATAPLVQAIQGDDPPPPPAPPPVQNGSSGNGGAIVKAGVAALDTIKVDADGKVEFHVSGFRWPFKDSRGANVVMGYIDADLGIVEGDLQPGANIPTPGLVVEWEKPDKYYNVKRVRKLT